MLCLHTLSGYERVSTKLALIRNDKEIVFVKFLCQEVFYISVALEM